MLHLQPEPNPKRPDRFDARATPGPRGESPGVTPRLLGLDALRGLAILLMCVSGLLPKYLPNAMYHGYYPAFLPQPAMTIDGAAVADEGGEVPLTWVAVENPWVFRGVEWPSFTWVDWVFPGFLFAMGAAIPLAYSRRLQRGVSVWRLAGSAAWRFLVLVAFAVYVKQISPWHQASLPGATVGLTEYWTSILGVLLLVPVLARLPRGTPSGLGWAIRGLGVSGAVVLMAAINDRATNPPFSWNASTGDADIIILLLAWSSLAASLLWIVTRRAGWLGWSVRLLVGLGLAFVAHDQGMRTDWRLLGESLNPVGEVLQWPREVLDLRPMSELLPGQLPGGVLDVSVLWDFTWLKFLWVVVPGTVIGDVLVRYLAERRAAGSAARPVSGGIAQSRVARRAAEGAEGVEAWGIGRAVIVSVGLIGCVVAVFVGLKDYAGTFATVGGFRLATPYAAVLLSLPPLVLALLAMLGRPDCGGAHGRALRRLTLWGTAWLTAGLVLAIAPDPRVEAAEGAELWATLGAGFFEGGIGKGPPGRLSWYLTSLGVSILLLVLLMLWTDVRGWSVTRWVGGGWLVANGQNPMLAYAMLSGPLVAIVALPTLMPFVAEGSPATLEGWVSATIARWYGPDASPWHDAGWDVVKTLLLAGLVWLATRRGVVLRS